MIEYKHLSIASDEPLLAETEGYIQEILDLSHKWVNENTSAAYQQSQREDLLGSEAIIAISQGDIVGYVYGSSRDLKEKTSYNEVGETVFEIEEIYVLPEYRHQGIGAKLFALMEETVSGRVDLLALIAVSREYPLLLKFYVDELGMTFQHALLTKRFKR